MLQYFRYENPSRKNVINLSWPKHPKINLNKNDVLFIFTLLCGVSESLHLFETVKGSVKIKKLCYFSSLNNNG